VTSLVLGVIGHVDHGKTALVRALTGEDTDRLPEEKERGISIALGFARLKAGADAEIDLIDMPGHERFVRTMISGATGIDAVLLVVAANEGIKPQTVEHIDIAGLLGLRRAVVAVSKADLVAPDEARRVGAEAKALLARAGLDSAEPVMTSALQETGLEDLRQALAALAAHQPRRQADGLAFLPIDRAFSVAGHGPVVTGTLRGAAVSMGDALELWPERRTVRVRAVQVRGVRVASAAPGQRVALNLRDVDTADLARGMALAAPDALAASEWLTIAIRAVADAPPLKNGMRLRALVGADELDVRLRLLDRDVLGPGEAGFAQLRCEDPAAAPAGEHVVLRLASPARTLAGGRILEPVARRQRRNCPRVLQRLEELRDLPLGPLMAAEVAREGAAGTSLGRLSQLTALAPSRVAELIQAEPVVVGRSGLVVGKAELDRLVGRIPALLAREASGLAREQLLSALPGTGAAVLDEALGRLVARGAVVRRGGQLLAPRPAEDRVRARDEAELASRIAETLRQGGLAPPDPGAIVTDLASKRALDRLVREGVVVRALDRVKEREILFHRQAIEEAQRRLAPLLQREEGLLVSEAGAALGVSRKYSMPILDHLDTIRFTRRLAERRTPGPAFSTPERLPPPPLRGPPPPVGEER
jgi:selenocysteine-specific elongation factor